MQWIIHFTDHTGKSRQTQPFSSLMAAQLAAMFVIPIDPHCRIEEGNEIEIERKSKQREV